MTGQPCGPTRVIGGAAALRAVELDFVGAGQADAVDFGGGPFEHRSLLVDRDSDPDELGPVRKQPDLAHLSDGNAGKADVGALVDPADRREIDVVALGGDVREAGEPHEKQQQADEQRHCHRADQHIVRSRLHLGDDPSHLGDDLFVIAVSSGTPPWPVEILLYPRMIQSQ